MNFAECLQAAVSAGEVDPERAKLARDEWQKLVDRYEASMSPALARQQAADDMVERMTKEVVRKRHINVLQLQTLKRNQARYGDGDSDRLIRDIDRVDNEAKGVFRQFMAGMQEFLAHHRETVTGKVRNIAQLNDIVREMMGEATGNLNAKEIAQAIMLQQERAIKLLNSLGGDVKLLANRGVRHTHDAIKLRSAGFEAWFKAVYNDLDWRAIENFKTGKPFAPGKGVKPFEEDAIEFLRPIFDDITTKGWDDRMPAFSVGAKALFNQRQAHRVLHFKSADAWLKYNDAFGSQNPFEAIMAEFTSLSRDIAMMRVFGPNPKAGLENAGQVLTKAAQLAARNPNGNRAGVVGKAVGYGLQPEEVVALDVAKAKFRLGLLTGESTAPSNPYTAETGRRTRNLLRAAHLGRAVFSMASDMPSMAMAAKAMKMNPTGPLRVMFDNMLNGIDPKTARDLGIIFDSWAQSGITMARVSGDIWQPEMTGRLSNFVLKMNGMTYLTDHQKVAVAMSFGSDLADLAGKSFDQLAPNLRNFMENRTIGAAEWDLLRAPGAIYTDARGVRHMNPNWFRANSGLPEAQANDLAIRLGGLIEDQIAYSIPEGRLRSQSAFLMGTKAGTVGGELVRSLGMYKGPAVTQMINYFRRWGEMDGGWATKAGFIGSLVAMQTVTGALTIQLKEISKGRDPRDMTRPSFWPAAFLQGGGIGILGDFLSASTARTGGGLAEVVAGPVVGLMGEVSRAVQTPGGAVDFARRNNPLASFTVGGIPVSLALDRIVWDPLQYLVDPEAAAHWRRRERSLQKNFGTQHWYRPGDLAPYRFPDLSNAIGGSR